MKNIVQKAYDLLVDELTGLWQQKDLVEMSPNFEGYENEIQSINEKIDQINIALEALRKGYDH